ncbi:fumarylacetoacetate hydrolase family protein [Hyphomonas chukchiensis]|uniref:Fumarylacetoacetase-like C-terminal domain-containing protein n=1 Tax=Hyphomonas chukchiensis TaxID=1280947 RepID=A0A062UC36_9PROT|nr:fumarylacetoacetate hydrolase family protein [Hyphomonas chukchiensis]KCZ58402.1 hypothetical protein HY30_16160 [Hyphomonas chukchiensis]|tara:strand:+ start:45897 stop:46769 length:873 start_codon:yes stop_codon:yes gene_type:complete
MKIGRVLIEGEMQIAIEWQGDAIPLSSILPDLGSDMISLIQNWDKHRVEIGQLLAAPPAESMIRSPTWKRPISRPGKMMAIGLNYADHIAESGMQTPERQLWFCKLGTSANDPFADIPLPVVSDQVDYEAELVAVIGKTCRHISAENARQYVFGYCVGNDVSVRDWQLASPQWILGKSFDGHAPFGPYITLDSAIQDPHRLDIRACVNGDLRQASNTRHLVFSLWDQIAHLSQAVTLEPGDLIFTGTPGGVGVAMTPPSFLKPGDRVKCEIEGLGYIDNQFRPESVSHGS